MVSLLFSKLFIVPYVELGLKIKDFITEFNRTNPIEGETVEKKILRFWQLFEAENLVPESPRAAHEAFKKIKIEITDDLLQGFFEEE
jgi:hypothetical protein